MIVDGITWHAVTLDEQSFAASKQLYINTFGLTPMLEMDGVAVFQFPNGSLLELYLPSTVPPYGYNDSLAFGFRVDDIEQASAEIEAAGGELLGEITRVEEMGYAYRHFRGPDGRVYGLNEQRLA
jgi:predicted enzyme related to lactoylglutathione lyase